MFVWVGKSTTCAAQMASSEGWWLVTGLAQGIGFLSTIGVF